MTAAAPAAATVPAQEDYNYLVLLAPIPVPPWALNIKLHACSEASTQAGMVPKPKKAW